MVLIVNHLLMRMLRPTALMRGEKMMQIVYVVMASHSFAFSRIKLLAFDLQIEPHVEESLQTPNLLCAWVRDLQ